MSEPWGQQPYPGGGFPQPGHGYGYGPPVPAPEQGRRARRCAVLAPVLLVLSVPAAALGLFLVLYGAISEASGSGDRSNGPTVVAGVVLVVVSGLLWLGSVVCSIIGLARTRGGYRWSAGITLALGVGSMPLLTLLSALTPQG